MNKIDNQETKCMEKGEHILMSSIKYEFIPPYDSDCLTSNCLILFP